MQVSTINQELVAPAIGEVGPAAGAQAENREVILAVRAINAADLFGEENELTFVLDRETRRALVRIVNRKTKELVRQIPAEYVLRMAEELRSRL